MALDVNARFRDQNILAFEQLSLQAGVRLADKDFAIFTDDAVPGNAFAGGAGAHSAAGAASAAAEAQSFRDGPIG